MSHNSNSSATGLAHMDLQMVSKFGPCGWSVVEVERGQIFFIVGKKLC